MDVFCPLQSTISGKFISRFVYNIKRFWFAICGLCANLVSPSPAKPESKYWICVFCVAPKSWHFYAAEQAPCLFIVGLMWRSRVIAHLNCNRQECQCQKFIRNSNILMWFGWKRATMEKTSKFWNTERNSPTSAFKVFHAIFHPLMKCQGSFLNGISPWHIK